MEPLIGADLSGVRIHRRSELPAELNAHAFAAGNQIHFAPGAFDPETPTGGHTLAHELAHVAQQDTTVRRILKFDDVLDNQVSTWKQVALQAFSPAGQADVVFTVAEFVVANLKRAPGGSPLPVDFQFNTPWVGKSARDATTATYDTNMLPLREELTEKVKKLTKPRVAAIRKQLQGYWVAMVDELIDNHAAGKAQLDEAADLTAEDILALQKGPPKRVVTKAARAAFATTHKQSTKCRYSVEDIVKAANVKVAADHGQPAWKVSAKQKLTPEQFAMFDRERKMIELRLAQWDAKAIDAPGTNPDGTYGTSFGGTGTKFADNALPKAVYESLLGWWKTVKGSTWSTESKTTDYSLKKDRIKLDAKLSPRFNYHIELAAA